MLGNETATKRINADFSENENISEYFWWTKIMNFICTILQCGFSFLSHSVFHFNFLKCKMVFSSVVHPFRH